MLSFSMMSLRADLPFFLLSSLCPVMVLGSDGVCRHGHGIVHTWWVLYHYILMIAKMH